MVEFQIDQFGVQGELLAEKAVYLQSIKTLLVSDIHLGKAETFQKFGIPVSNQTNQTNLDRLSGLCARFQPDHLMILGDLFHAKVALTHDLLQSWIAFTDSLSCSIKLILGNHDRPLRALLHQETVDVVEILQIQNLILSHEPYSLPSCFNICGHVHPCIRITSKLDRLRLPCFYLNSQENRLLLPSFGEFTGGYDMELTPGAIAYLIVEDQIIEWST